MGNDLIAWIVAIALGGAVVALGFRRNLDDTTRNWLPWLGEGSARATVTLESSDGGRRPHPLSPRQRRWMVGGYLLMSLWNGALAISSADGRLFRVIMAALFALFAVLFLMKKWPPESAELDTPSGA